MPFEKAQPPDDADGLISPEIEILADQLRQDAQWLAYQFPASKPRVPLRQRRSLRWVAVGSVAALLLVSIDAGYMWWHPAKHSSPENKLVQDQPQAPRVPSAPHAEHSGLMAPAATLPRGLSYPDLSPAEKEGVLDLLEKHPPPKKFNMSL